MRGRGWRSDIPHRTLRARATSIIDSGDPWWDWGHHLMALVGQDDGGNWSEPEPATWWYRLGTPRRQWRTGYPAHPLGSIEIITDYATFRARTDGLNEDQLEEWQAICVDQDSQLILGRMFWGRPFFGLSRWEVALLRRYLRAWRRRDWFGLRTWLYVHALHAAVHRRRPFTCQATPPRGSGGYQHWYCTEKRNHHHTPHRAGNYIWTDRDKRVQYLGDHGANRGAT